MADDPFGRYSSSSMPTFFSVVLLRDRTRDGADARSDGRRGEQRGCEVPDDESGGTADPRAGGDLTGAVLVDGDPAVVTATHHDRGHDLEIG